MNQLVIDLEPGDFEALDRREPGYLGAYYPFMQIVGATLDASPIKLLRKMTEFRFETAEGLPWGGLEPDFWASVRADELHKRKGFLVGRLWTKQQVLAAQVSLGKDDADLGMIFKYGNEVRAAFGVPARIAFKF